MGRSAPPPAEVLRPRCYPHRDEKNRTKPRHRRVSPSPEYAAKVAAITIIAVIFDENTACRRLLRSLKYLHLTALTVPYRSGCLLESAAGLDPEPKPPRLHPHASKSIGPPKLVESVHLDRVHKPSHDRLTHLVHRTLRPAWHTQVSFSQSMCYLVQALESTSLIHFLGPTWPDLPVTLIPRSFLNQTCKNCDSSKIFILANQSI